MVFSKSRFNPISALAALAVATTTFTSTGAFAAEVCGPSAVPIPADNSGVYLNLVTGATGNSGSGVAGWDINLFRSSQLYFFWPGIPVGSSGGLAVSTVYQALNGGALIDASGSYSNASGGGGPLYYVNWQTTNTGKYLGVRFYNEATSAINYGWLQLDTGAAGGFPATINSCCYQNSGAGIMAGGDKIFVNSFDS